MNYPQSVRVRKSVQRQCTRLCALPAWNIARRRLLRQAAVELRCIADKSWVVAPGSMVKSSRAFYLPNQLDRVTGSAYTDNPVREMSQEVENYQRPTRAYLVKNAWLVDGAIYKGNASHYLHPRSSILKQFRVDAEMDRASIYSTFEGNGFFGLWLTDDCTAFPLALEEGVPITTAQPASAHQLQYEDWLDMDPLRVPNMFLREVVFFDDDLTQNLDKRRRFRQSSEKIRSRVDVTPHPGTFIIRGSSGKRRIMHNELEMAEYLREQRGFRVVDVNVDDVPTIAAACAGAQVLVGVEGSHMTHGVMVLQPGCSILTLQPPTRFCSVLKRTTDRDGQNFGFVVGRGLEAGFRVDPTEVERTLDLLPQTHVSTFDSVNRFVSTSAG